VKQAEQTDARITSCQRRRAHRRRDQTITVYSSRPISWHSTPPAKRHVPVTRGAALRCGIRSEGARGPDGKATEEISSQIAGTQNATQDSIAAIGALDPIHRVPRHRARAPTGLPSGLAIQRGKWGWRNHLLQRRPIWPLGLPRCRPGACQVNPSRPAPCPVTNRSSIASTW
jgi:hypothetical protein